MESWRPLHLDGRRFFQRQAWGKDHWVKRGKSALAMLTELGRQMERPEDAIRIAEKMLGIRDRSGRVHPLRANEAQRRFEMSRGRQNIVLKARQMGITTWVAGRFFLRTALCPGVTTLLVAHNRESAEMLFGIVGRFWELLPEEVREGELRLRRFNSGEMIFAATGSEFRVASAADANAGRGLSLQNLHCSEVSRWPGHARETLAGLRAALAPEGELVMESTPAGAYGAFYDEWQAATWPGGEEASLVEGAARAFSREGPVRHFLPWWLEPSYLGPALPEDELTPEERTLVAVQGLRPEQIGFRRVLEKSYGPLRSQEFAEDAETCFRATGSCCFELNVLERRMQELGEPVRRQRNGALLEWLPPVPGRRYVVAVDTAGGGEDGDFAAVQVLDVQTGMQCAELQERLRPAALAELCERLAARYGDAPIAVERNNHGAAVLALLEMRPGLRLYRQSGQAGWLTSSASKPEMIARLGTLLQQTPERFFSKRLLAECRTFVSDEHGRAGAAAGTHDDLVMSMAIGQAVRAEELMGTGLVF